MSQAFNNLMFFVQGVWQVMTSNWLLSVPIALFIIWHALDILKNVLGLLKKGG